MAVTPNPLGILTTVLVLGVVPTIGMMLGGAWFATFAFVAAAVIVTMRALRKHAFAMREPDALSGGFTSQQAIGMLSAMRGQPLAGSVLARVEETARLGETDPNHAYARVLELLAESPRNVAARGLRARLAFVLGRSDAVQRWNEAVRIALEMGSNAIAAATFIAHREHREALALGSANWRALAWALDAKGHRDDARWARARATPGA